MEHKKGGGGRPDERGHIPTPPWVGLRGRPQPFRGRRVPRVVRARQSWSALAGCAAPNPRAGRRRTTARGFRRTRGGAQLAPSAGPLRAHNVGVPRGHRVAAGREHPAGDSRNPHAGPGKGGGPPVGDTPGCRPRCGGRPRGPCQGAGEGGGQFPSAAVSHRCTRAAALWGARRSCSSRWLWSSHTKSPNRSMCCRNLSTEVPTGGS